ncbi:hypothetical protein [Mycobacterium sp. M26]|uniref:hypothetical protein n=1 Tax=Mycobacterium sp. M26 TaxID=1762962 RepID=UPI00073EE0D8|nr:hypothetical protein [Mycobacterium sp. M26]
MDVAFEQAGAIPADELDADGDSRRVAAWDHDRVVVLAFGLRAGGSEDDPELDGWGAPDDAQAMRYQFERVPPAHHMHQFHRPERLI